jgi:hypothetical protein
VYVEAGKRRVFACALDWPGWARAARMPDAALAALTAYAPRYAAAVAGTGVDFAAGDTSELAVIESVTGTATTDFGALDVTPRADAGPHPPGRYGRAAVLVQAAWDALAAAAAGAPAELSRGPRGGGRDRDAILWHVLETEILHARMLGGRHRPPAREIPPPLPPPGPTSWTRSGPARSLNRQKEQREGAGPSCSSPGVRPGTAWIMPGNCRTAPPDPATALQPLAWSRQVPGPQGPTSTFSGYPGPIRRRE